MDLMLGRKTDRIEEGILPLVNVLNSIRGLKTHFSCEGHFKDPEPWVIFTSEEFELPYEMWQALMTVQEKERGFNFFWIIRPYYVLYKGLPGFMIEGRKTFPLNLKNMFRWKRLIAEDIERLEKLVFNRYKNLEERGQNQNYETQIERKLENPVGRIKSPTMRTPSHISGDVLVANHAFNQITHEKPFKHVIDPVLIEYRHREVFFFSSSLFDKEVPTQYGTISLGNDRPVIPLSYDEVLYVLTYMLSSVYTRFRFGGPKLIFTHLTNAYRLWELVDTLREAYKNKVVCWIHTQGYFLRNEIVILKIEKPWRDGPAIDEKKKLEREEKRGIP